MTDLIGGAGGFTEEEMYALGDDVADAFMGGLIPGTVRFSRALLGAGWRRSAAPVTGFEPPTPDAVRIHYFVVGASELRAGWFGWQCSCTESAKHAYPDPPNAFANALAHLPAGDAWRAKGERGE